jgi:ubiquitin carboxyl-terminal hydrolase 7
MSAKFTYDQVAAKIGEKLDIDPTHIRFHTVNASNSNPKTPVKRNLTQTLQTILTPPYSTFGNNNQRPDALFFEILEMSLSELDTKKNMKITWLSDGITKEVSALLIKMN